MATAHILGGYTFEFNPEQMTIPESKKTVSSVQTYSGSAVFQWPALIQGEVIELFWTVMSVEMYEAFRALYVSEDAITFDPQYAGTYQVIVEDLTGKYIDGVLDNNPHRIDVSLKLNIRSFTAA